VVFREDLAKSPGGFRSSPSWRAAHSASALDAACE
jgi:hypothetical protein